jgi:5-hydroxyisourate hydrolase
MAGKLTTHVLDLTKGLPANGIEIELWAIEDHDERSLLKTTITNDDGRVDFPLLTGEEMLPGEYELIFKVKNYFNGDNVSSPRFSFLNKVPIRFGITSQEEHYHVPLLLAPGGYSTYRGS